MFVLCPCGETKIKKKIYVLSGGGWPTFYKLCSLSTLFKRIVMSTLLQLTKQASLRWSQQLPRTLPTTGKRFYKLSVGSIKKGQIVQFKDKAWRVLGRDHVSTGRGGAVVKVFPNSLIIYKLGSHYFFQ